MDMKIKLIGVTPELFERHIEYLSKNSYIVLSLDELVEMKKAGVRPKRKTVIITFDDGYENNYEYAYKTLKKFGYPATIFVPSDNVGQKDFLKLFQIKEMISNRIDIGSHGKDGNYLPGRNDEDIVEQIERE